MRKTKAKAFDKIAEGLNEALAVAKGEADPATYRLRTYRVEKTPVEILIELGRALHGEHWIGPTSRDLGIKHSTVANWVSGKSRLREGPILDALRLLVKSHTQAVARAREISAARPSTPSTRAQDAQGPSR